jgi:hypothetical protein
MGPYGVPNGKVGLDSGTHDWTSVSGSRYEYESALFGMAHWTKA